MQCRWERVFVIGWQGMIKLNITLPSGAQVSIEADDKELVREVLYSAMPHLNGVAHESNGETNGSALEPPVHHNGSQTNGQGSVPAQPMHVSNGAEPARDVTPATTNGNHAPGPTATIAAPVNRQPAPVEAAPAVPVAAAPAYAPSTPDEHEYIAFCQRVNPLGDMRRVVVAAEAAHRHLAVQSVDPEELERLFTLAGWSIPHSFVQTLRNAARTKFRWLERIPGKPGHYRVTDTGRKIVLGENSPARRGPQVETEPEAEDQPQD